MQPHEKCFLLLVITQVVGSIS